MRAVAIAVVGLLAASCAMAPPVERSSGRAATPAPTTAGGMAVPADTPVPLDPATVGLT